MKTHHTTTLRALATSLLLAPLVAGCGTEKAAFDGTKLFFYTSGEAISVAIDGGTANTIQSFKGIAVGPGKHTIAIAGRPDIIVEMKAFDELVVPVVDQQCYMSLDVSNTFYGEKRPEAPPLRQRMAASEPFEMPARTFVDKKALPNSIKAGESVMLLRSLPCDDVDDLEFGLKGKVTIDSLKLNPAGMARARVRKAAHCREPAAADAFWCTAARGWGTGEAAPLPETPQAFVGVSLRLEDGGDDAELLKTEPSLSVLALRPDSLAHIRGLAPQAPDAAALAADAVKAVQARLRGDGPEVKLAGEFGAFLSAMPERAKFVVKQRGSEWSIAERDAMVRKSGETWVLMERLPKEEAAWTFTVYVPFTVTEAVAPEPTADDAAPSVDPATP